MIQFSKIMASRQDHNCRDKYIDDAQDQGSNIRDQEQDSRNTV